MTTEAGRLSRFPSCPLAPKGRGIVRHLLLAHIFTQYLSSLAYFFTLLLETVSLLDCIFMSSIDCILAHHDSGWGTGKGLFGNGHGPGITSLDVRR